MTKDQESPGADPQNDGVDTVRISITPALTKFAHHHADMPGFQAAVEREIDQIDPGSDAGPDSIYDIAFHVMSWKGEFNVVLFPNEEGTCLVADLCTMEDKGAIPSGPMQGHRMMLPRPLSQKGHS